METVNAVIVSISAIALALIYKASESFSDIIAIINAAVLSITAWIVWEYTKAAQKSNEIQERPILNLHLIEIRVGPNQSYKLELKNIGRAPAFNISINQISADGYNYIPSVGEENPILEINQSKQVKFRVRTPNDGTEAYDQILGFTLLINRLFPTTPDREAHRLRIKAGGMFLVNYDTVSGNKYHSIFRLYPRLPIWGILSLTAEFIKAGDGLCDIESAKLICEAKPALEYE